MPPPGRSAHPGRPAMGRSLSELLESYLDPEGETAPDASRRPPSAEVRAVLATALELAAAVVPDSVVGIAHAPGDGPTVVRLAGVGDVERSLALADRLADDGSRGLADVRAEHLVLRAGDRLRLGVDRGGSLDAGQRQLLEGVALLASRALARSGSGPLGAVGRLPVPPPSATGPDPADGPGVEVA